MRYLTNRSLLILVLSVFFFGFFAISTVQHYFYADKYYVSYNEKRLTRLFRDFELLYTLLADDRPGVVADRLEFSIENIDMDFFRLSKKNEGILAELGEMPEVDFKKNEIVIENGYGYLSTTVNDYDLTAGIRYDFSVYHYEAYKKHREYIFRDAILMALVLLGTIIYFFRDFWIVLSAVSTGNLARLKKVKSLSHEALVLKDSLEAFEKQVAEKDSENAMLKNQILPALKSELFSGQSPPYDFDCVLVRTDVNHFSNILKSHDKQQFLETINDFFTICTRVISRYDGVVSEFLGDEIIYYFKDNKNQPSIDAAVLALSALRDIHQVAESFHALTQSERDYPFLIKSSLSEGELNFGKQVDRYTISGTPLIETVRILSQIHTRDRNCVWMSEAVKKRVNEFASTTSQGVFELKGLEDVEIHEVEQFTKLGYFLQHNPSIEKIKYFRSDSDYILLVQKFILKDGAARTQNPPVSGQERTFKNGQTDLARGKLSQPMSRQVTELVRQYPPFGASGELRQFWFDAIHFCLKKPDGQGDDKALSSLVSSSFGILSGQSLKASEAGALKKLLTHPSHRVVANTVDLLSRLLVFDFAVLVKPLLQHSHHRVRVSTMVYLLKLKWSADLVRSIKKMLQSKKQGVQASGLWATEQVYNHYRATNPVVIESNPEFLEVLKIASERVGEGLSLVGDGDYAFLRELERLKSA